MPQPPHNIETLIEQSSFYGDAGVSDSVRRSAFEAVAIHPNFAAALAHPHCRASIWRESKSFFDESSWPNETKKEILDRLSDTDSFLVLSFLTSDVESGEYFWQQWGGTTFDFLLHPATFEIIDATLGHWRA
jgi:hypothetical protein